MLKKSKNEFTRYSISAICAFIADILILYLLTEWITLHYTFSSIIAISFGFTINYLLNIRWVFENRIYRYKPIKEYTLMIIISLILSIVNIILMWILTYYLNIYYISSKLFASIITFLLKFTLRKEILFRGN